MKLIAGELKFLIIDDIIYYKLNIDTLDTSDIVFSNELFIENNIEQLEFVQLESESS